MTILPLDTLSVLAQFAPAYTRTTFRRFLVLAVAAVLAPGPCSASPEIAMSRSSQTIHHGVIALRFARLALPGWAPAEFA